MVSKQETITMLDEMHRMFPNAHCELRHANPFELVVAVALSAQCTDVLVNRVTEHLFEKYKTPQDYLNVEVEELMNDIRSIGLFRNKAKNIQKLSAMIIEEFGGQVPATRDELVLLPGVGRKTANVVLSVAFNEPAIAVDTHVERVSKRLGITRRKDTVLQVEETLMKKIPRERWAQAHHQLIFFGRYFCKAQNPRCNDCPLLEKCREGKIRTKKKGGSEVVS
ncbi:MAG: endonuclease III [Bacilli bacterium]